MVMITHGHHVRKPKYKYKVEKINHSLLQIWVNNQELRIALSMPTI